MSYGWLIGGGAALFLIGAFRWRTGVIAALVLAIFEGAIRKWLLPQASQMVYFGKDFLLLGAYCNFFLGPDGKDLPRFPDVFAVFLVGSLCWTFLECFNPGTGSLIAGFFGWKAYIMYLPLLVLVPRLFKTQQEFQTFLRYYVLLALPVGVLGLVQFKAGPDSPLNVYAPGAGSGTPGESNIAVFGEDQFVRITGTFSYISGYAAYLLVMLSLLVPVLAFSGRGLWTVAYLGTLLLVIGNVMMTGSRSAALGAGSVLAGFAFLTPATGTNEERKRAWVHWFAGTAAVIAAIYVFEDAASSLEDRATNNWDEGKNRLIAAVVEPWTIMGDAGVFGFGCGISQPSVAALRSTLHLPDPLSEYASATDAENSRVMMELGVPGFLLWYGLRIAILIGLWKTRAGLKSPLLRQFALGAFLVMFFQFFTVTMFAHTANIYHWFFAGFIFLLPRLDHLPVEAAAESRQRRWRRRKNSQPEPATGTLQA